MASKLATGRNAVLAALEKGNTRRAAAAAAGIHHDTFYQWLKDDPTFSDAVEKAEATSEQKLVAIIRQEAKVGTWQAAAWLLERHPRTKQDWKRVDELDLRKLTVDQLLALEATCARGIESAGDRMAVAEREG